MKKLTGIIILAFVFATTSAFLYHEYNKPQEQCVEDLVDVVCKQIESGNANCDPVGQYRFKIPYQAMDSTRLYWVVNKGDSGNWIGQDELKHLTNNMLYFYGTKYTPQIVSDSIKFRERHVTRYIDGNATLFQTHNIAGIYINFKNQLKIRAAINRHREIQLLDMEKEQLQKDKENIQRACDIVKKLI